MNQQSRPDEERPALEDQLVGYLDGELDAKAASLVERALATDPGVRQELWQLERSWQLLDELPRIQVDEAFTRTTVEMIAVKAEAELAAIEQELPRKRRRTGLLAGGALLAVAALSFLTVTILARRADDKLLQDLPVIENLDGYRDVEDLEFLRMLHASGFLPKEAKNDR